MNKITHKS